MSHPLLYATGHLIRLGLRRLEAFHDPNNHFDFNIILY